MLALPPPIYNSEGCEKYLAILQSSTLETQRIRRPLCLSLSNNDSDGQDLAVASNALVAISMEVQRPERKCPDLGNLLKLWRQRRQGPGYTNKRQRRKLTVLSDC